MVFFLITFPNLPNCQSAVDGCFTDIDNEIPGRWENPETMYVPYYVNVYFHIIKDNNGNGGAPASRVNDIMNQLNSAFNQHYIYFTNNSTIDYIDNSFWFNIPFGSQSHTLNSNSDGIDIYLYPETESCSGANAYCVGNSNLGITFFGTLRETGFKLSEFAAAHEMGHMLGLPHTFENSFGDEDVDGSDCLTEGDRFCDTPASPARTVYLPCANTNVLGGLNFEVSPYPNCNWLNPATEPGTGLLYTPDATNYMDYSHPTCYSSFSNEQVKAMRAKMERSNLIDDVVCSNIWGDVTYGVYTNSLQTVNFVSSQSIDVDVEAIQTTSFTWQLYSGSGSWSTYNNGQEMSLYMSSGGSASFHISYSNPCNLGPKSVTFVHSGGWYSVYSNPTFDCVDIQAIEDYEIEYIDDKGKLKKLKIKPKLKKLKVLDQSGNTIIMKTFSGNKKYYRLCLSEHESGLYHVIINENDSDMVTKRIIKL